MDYIKNLMNNNKFLKIVSIVLVVAIVLTSVVGIAVNVIGGKKINCEEKVAAYNGEAKDFSEYFTSMSEDEMAKRLDRIDAQLISIIAMADVDTMLYTDEVATFVARYTAELIGKEFSDTKFKSMKKSFPEAYEFVKAAKKDGKTWADLGTIPFGIEAGDKEAFIKACGAGAETFGKNLIKVMFSAPAAYNDALVPVIESLHTVTMPTMSEFVKATGLSGSKRMEFLVEKILTVVEPVKAAPLTYLCEIAPDFFRNYTAAAEYLNGKKGVEKRAHLVMPSIEEVLNEVLAAVNVKVPALDIVKVVTMGTASVDASGANNGQRVRLDGNREVVYAFFSDYILGTLVHENNFDVIRKVITKDLKTDEMINSKAGELLNSDMFAVFLADYVDLVTKIQGRVAPDVQAEVDAYNAESKDFSALFAWPSTEENVTKTIATLDALIIGSLSDFNIYGILYSDAFATAIAKITAPLCSVEISDLSFNALRKSFPEAYKYMMDAQAAGKTWDDIDVIPFGISAGDRDMFIKACAAGSEHFGDALALCGLAEPTAYENALIPVLEALHVGPMPAIRDFMLDTRLDGVKRAELIIEHVLGIVEPLMAAPVTYLCEMLPDLISSYNKASEFAATNPNILSKSGVNIMPLNELLAEIVEGYGIVLPEFDYAAVTKYGTARAAASGDITGQRFEIVGDKEAVFVALSGFISDVAATEGNITAIGSFLEDKLLLPPDIVRSLITIFEDVVIALDGLDLKGKLSSLGGLFGA